MVRLVSGLVEVSVFTIGASGPEYLLLRRSPSEKIYPGLWQFVTGSIEANETATDAALRELSEETGMRPDSFWVVPHVISFYDPPRDTIHLSPLFAALVKTGTPPKLSPEHSEYIWCGYDEAVRTLVWPGQREGLRILHDFIVLGEPAVSLLKIF